MSTDVNAALLHEETKLLTASQAQPAFLFIICQIVQYTIVFTFAWPEQIVALGKVCQVFTAYGERWSVN